MIINQYNNSHKGIQPIRVLEHNIISQFESTNPTFLKLSEEIILKKGLKKGIRYYSVLKAINELIDDHNQTPHIGKTKQIVLHEAFLAYIWKITYSLLVLYEEALAKPLNNKYCNTDYKLDQDAIDIADELFQNATSNIVLFTEWDKEYLPNPELYDSKIRQRVEEANAVFVYAVNMILCHEFAHVENEHIEKVQAGQGLRSHILKFEKEADQRAIDLILSDITDGRQKLTAELGVLIGICCMLFFKDKTTNEKHPDIDERIDSFIQRINPDETSAIWGLAVTAYYRWSKQFGKKYTWPTNVNSLKDIYEAVKKQIVEDK